MAGVNQELVTVVAKIRELDPDGARIGGVLRDTLDQLYDGRHTGRYRWDQLYKTEKTHCGTLVEINLQRECGFDDGLEMDYTVAEVEIDCEYSPSVGGRGFPSSIKQSGVKYTLCWIARLYEEERIMYPEYEVYVGSHFAFAGYRRDDAEVMFDRYAGSSKSAVSLFRDGEPIRMLGGKRSVLKGEQWLHCPNCGALTLALIEETEPDTSGEYREVRTCGDCGTNVQIVRRSR